MTEGPRGHTFSASVIPAVNKRLDASLAAFARRRLEEPFAQVVLGARHEKVREAGIVGSRAVLVAVGIDREGRRRVLAVELANRESCPAWEDFPLGLKAALREVLPGAFVQRCHVHFLRDAPDHVPRKADDGCARELRRLPDRRELAEAKADRASWPKRWSPRYPKLTGWVEETIEETFTCYRLARRHRKRMESTNKLERLDEEIKRRTYVVRIFPNAESCLRLVRALAGETHEDWLEANRYLSMDDLKEQKKLQLREAA